MSKRFKKRSETVKIQKEAGNLKSVLREYPVFCFRYIDKKLHPSNISPENQKALLDKFYELCQLEWIQIMSSSRHGLGTEKIEQKDLKFTLPRHVAEDVTIIALRYSGKMAMVGYRSEGNVFHILGVDISFNDSCYNHSG